MAMKRCPVCGEKYSDTYKRCPFCEEEEALRNGETPRRHGGHRVAQSGPSLLSPILILLIFVLAGFLIYLLFGDTISKKLGIEAPAASSSVISSAPAVSSGSAAASSASSQTPSGPAPETAVALSRDDFTLSAGEAYALEATQGGGKYTWTSENESVATVSSSGLVTAVGGGTTNITVTDGYTTAQCIVRVKGAPAAGGTTTTQTSGSAAALSRTDVSISVGESFSLSVTGTSSTAAFASGNSAVASVASDGKVTGVKSGRTTITATVDGKTLSCIVRVK